MDLLKSAKKFSPLEIGLLLVFIIYIIFPIQTPAAIRPLIDSPMGIVAVFLITVSLFVYTSPILGIVYIFVAYELLRRSSVPKQVAKSRVEDTRMTNYMPNHTPKSIPVNQFEKDMELRDLNPPKALTLEEEVIQQRAPIGKSEPVAPYSESSFKPVADNVAGASMF
jgi:hypothetical protein